MQCSRRQRFRHCAGFAYMVARNDQKGCRMFRRIIDFVWGARRAALALPLLMFVAEPALAHFSGADSSETAAKRKELEQVLYLKPCK